MIYLGGDKGWVRMDLLPKAIGDPDGCNPDVQPGRWNLYNRTAGRDQHYNFRSDHPLHDRRKDSE
jgi:hypothetical protein